jgi:hypothetical protein
MLASSQERGMFIKASFHQLIGDRRYPIREMIPPEMSSFFPASMDLMASHSPLSGCSI